MHAEVLLDRDLSSADLPRLDAFDLVFFKSKSPVFLDVMEALEGRETARVINSVEAVRLTRHRQLGAQRVAAAGVPIADDFLGALGEVPFDQFVIKGEFEDDPAIPRLIITEEQREAALGDLGEGAHIYVQRYIPSDWEYKLYAVQRNVFAFRQRPTLINPNKHATRQPIDLPTDLAAFALSSATATGLETIGVDFLLDGQQPLLTDINSIQGVQNFSAGCEALIVMFAEHLALAAQGAP
jgi:glutathione synthase/RimK-type ligase-like ATP-grasp enzyme